MRRSGIFLAFPGDTQEHKPRLIIVRRADVKHHNWWGRVKRPAPYGTDTGRSAL
jgi:hypothetical protein